MKFIFRIICKIVGHEPYAIPEGFSYRWECWRCDGELEIVES